MRALHEMRRFKDDFPVWYGSYVNIEFFPHWQKEIELIYVRRGRAKITVGENSFFAGQGDIVLCSSGEIHSCQSADMDNYLDFLVFDPTVISSVSERCQLGVVHVPNEELERLGLVKMCREMLETAARELKEQKPYYREVVKACIRQFWYSLKRCCPQKETAEHDEKKRTQFRRNIQPLMEYLSTHYNTSVPQAAAAERMKLTPCHFSRAFKEYIGVSYVTYVNMLRIENAIEQLLSTDCSVLDAAMDCGFNNIRTFNRVFKEITGHTPTEFCKLSDPKYPEYKVRKQFFTPKQTIVAVEDSGVIVTAKKEME